MPVYYVHYRTTVVSVSVIEHFMKFPRKKKKDQYSCYVHTPKVTSHIIIPKCPTFTLFKVFLHEIMA